jgi:CRISPR-associated protein Cmr5
MNKQSDAMQTPEQRRAADALRALQQLGENHNLRKSYRSYVERLGPSILINGLGQALATERAAATSKPEKPDERAHHLLYANLGRWLCREGGIYPGGTDVLEAIVQHGETHYLRAQAEALAWLVWHKKLSRAYLPMPDDSEN